MECALIGVTRILDYVAYLIYIMNFDDNIMILSI